MKVIAESWGRVVQLYLEDEVRPNRQGYLPDVLHAVKERYAFLTHSTVEEAINGAKFQTGRLLVDGVAIGIEALEIYKDGIIASSRNTRDANLILEDAMEWGIETIGMKRPQTQIARTFSSCVVVDFEKPISAAINRFRDIQALLQQSYEDAYAKSINLEVSRIAFAADPKSVPPHTNTEYLFERRGSAPFSMERYFCAAPLQTDEHISLLEKLEAIIG